MACRYLYLMDLGKSIRDNEVYQRNNDKKVSS